MSASDINLDVSYFDWPEVKRLAGLLGRDTEALPLRLWAHCGAVHSEDGRLADYSAGEVEAIVDWRGDRGKMVEAMVKVGFLRPLAGQAGFEVMIRAGETWLERNGHIAAYKAKGRAMARAKQARVQAEAGEPTASNTDSSTASTTDSSTASIANRAVQSYQSELTDRKRRNGGGDITLPAQQRQRQRARAFEGSMVVEGFQPSDPPSGWAPADAAALAGIVLSEPTAADEARMRRERGLLARRMPFGADAGLRVQDLSGERCAWYLDEWEGRAALDPHLRRALELRRAQYAEERRR